MLQKKFIHIEILGKNCRTFQRKVENLVLKAYDSFELTLYDGLRNCVIEEF